MNCKPRDLAVFVRSRAGNLGLIVRCLSFVPAGTVLGNGICESDGWITDVTVMQTRGMRICYAEDKNLRPIRDQDGEDEMIRIAGKPKTKEHSR